MTNTALGHNKYLFEKAYSQYEKELRAYSLSKTNNKALAQDLVQETFLKAWSYIADGKEIETMKAFLYRILNCLIVNEYRKRKSVSLDEMHEQNFDPTDPEEIEHNIDEIDGHLLIPIIQKLPEKYQKVLLGRYHYNLSLDEISMMTKQTKNTVTVQLKRAVEKLKELCPPPIRT